MSRVTKYQIALAPDLRQWREAVPNDRFAHLLKESTRCIARLLQQRLAEHDIPIGYWVFLRVLWEREGITQRALSELAGVSDPTTYSALLAMEKQGYITREKQPGNRRNINVYLTPAGRALKDVLVPIAEETNRIALRGVPRADVAIVRRTLLTVIENLEADNLAWLERKGEQ